MKDSRENLIKRFLCAKTNTKIVNQENKLYYFFLHEDLYPIIFQNTDSSFGKFSSVFRKTNIKKNHRESFLTIKSCIFLFRSNNFSSRKRSFFSNTRFHDHKKKENFLPLPKKVIFSLFFESITFILLCNQKKSDFEKQFFQTKDLSISIQKPLASLERQWQYYSFGFQGCFSYFFHPEVVLRILRKKFQDISFLHLLRKFLHFNVYLSNNTVKEVPTNNIRTILWNIYFLEIDSFFVSICKNYCISDEINNVSSNYSLSCFEKIQEWTYFVEKQEYKDFFEKKLYPYEIFDTITIRNSEERRLDKKRQISFLDQSKIYKYFRTNTNWFIFFQKQKPENILFKRWIILFFIRRLGYILQENTINWTLTFSEYQNELSAYFFLAYILQFPKKKNFVKINTKLFFLVHYFVRRVISFLNPLYLIILLLSKQNFCNSFGYPKSKSGWVTWTDTDIIQNFTRLQNNLFFFYSGCTNTKALARIHYILHFSCVKTLACKHKTNLRYIYKKFGTNLTRKDFATKIFVTNQSKNFRLRSLWKNQKMTRVWNFRLTQLNSLIFHLETFYRLR